MFLHIYRYRYCLRPGSGIGFVSLHTDPDPNFNYTNPDPRIRIHITEFSAGPWWAKIELFVLRNNITMSFQECFPWPGCGERGDHLGHEIFGGGSCKFSVPVLHLQLRISEGLRHPVHYPPALGGQARRAWHQVHHQQKGQTWQKW